MTSTTTRTSVESSGTFAGLPTNLQFIGGDWREGGSAKTLTVTNPYDDSELTVIRQASIEDLDQASRDPDHQCCPSNISSHRQSNATHRDIAEWR